MRRLLLAIAAFVLAAAVGVASAGSSRYVRHTVPGQGVSLLLPSSWKAISKDQTGKIVASLSDIARDHPEFAGAVAQLRQSNSPMKFLAFDPTPVRGFATNANVVITPLPGPVPPATFRRALVREVKTLPISNLVSDVVQLAAGPAVRLSYRLTVTQKGKRVTVSTTQYAFPRPTRSVVITYTTLPSALAVYRPIFDTSARSIRLAR